MTWAGSGGWGVFQAGTATPPGTLLVCHQALCNPIQRPVPLWACPGLGLCVPDIPFSCSFHFLPDPLSSILFRLPGPQPPSWHRVTTGTHLTLKVTFADHPFLVAPLQEGPQPGTLPVPRGSSAFPDRSSLQGSKTFLSPTCPCLQSPT